MIEMENGTTIKVNSNWRIWQHQKKKIYYSLFIINGSSLRIHSHRFPFLSTFICIMIIQKNCSQILMHTLDMTDIPFSKQNVQFMNPFRIYLNCIAFKKWFFFLLWRSEITWVVVSRCTIRVISNLFMSLSSSFCLLFIRSLVHTLYISCCYHYPFACSLLSDNPQSTWNIHICNVNMACTVHSKQTIG